MLRRLGGFFTLPLISAVTPLALLPVVAREVGSAGWSSLGVGQSLGTMGSVVVMFGWWLLGPARLSECKSSMARRELYFESVYSRGLVLALVAPIVVLATFSLTPSGWWVTASLYALAVTITGLAPSWYMIGAGSPGLIAKFDTIPRAAATLASAVLIGVSGMVWVYPALLTAVCLGSWCLFTIRHIPGAGKPRASLRQAVRSLRSQVALASSSAIGTLYTSTPVPLASGLAGATGAAGFTSAERLYRFSLNAIVALANTLQSWVQEAESGRARRQRIAFLAHIALGAVGGLGLALLGRLLSGLLFGASMRASWTSCAFFGLTFFFISCSTPLTRNILVPARRGRVVVSATLGAAVTGVPAMILLYRAFGTDGIVMGLALSEALVFAVVGIATAGMVRRSSATTAGLLDEDRSQERV
jgi:O-antigen/teichoic acid export membrane protein